ncbi:MAG: GTPase Era [Gemmatimonadetes bacterium]|nr:GTPase Era [Gemmatimonadota bacterium]
MTKADLVEQVAEAIGPGITKKDCALVVDGLLNAVKRALANGENIEIRGFGTFKVRKRKSRMARNPRTGEGVGRLLATLVKILPEAPALYPEDQISDRPMRFLAAELVREAAMEELSQEIPYSLAVDVVEYKEDRPGLTRIRADLLVERATQKQIVIGRGGQLIKAIGIRARREIEALIGNKVHLELWVKVEARWAKHPKRLKTLGYS